MSQEVDNEEGLTSKEEEPRQLDDPRLPPDLLQERTLFRMTPHRTSRHGSTQDTPNRLPLRRRDDERDACEEDPDSDAHDKVEDGHRDNDGPDGDVFEASDSSMRVPDGLHNLHQWPCDEGGDGTHLFNEIQSEDEDQSTHNADREVPNDSRSNDEHTRRSQRQQESRQPRVSAYFVEKDRVDVAEVVGDGPQHTRGDVGNAVCDKFAIRVDVVFSH